MSSAVCEMQLRAADAFIVNVHTGYRPLCLWKPQTSGLCHGEESVSTWTEESGIWACSYVLSSGWLFVSYFIYDVVLTTDGVVCAILLLIFFNRRATLGLTWEVHCSLLVRVSTGIITTEQPEKQTQTNWEFVKNWNPRRN